MSSGNSIDQPIWWEWAQLSFLLGKELIGSPIYKISNYFPTECAIYKIFIYRHLFSRFSFYGSIWLIPYWFDYSDFIAWWIMCKASFPASHSSIWNFSWLFADIYFSKQTFMSLYPILKSTLMQLYLEAAQIYRIFQRIGIFTILILPI